MAFKTKHPNAIEMCTIPKEYIKPFFGWVSELRVIKDTDHGIELCIDKNNIYYSIADITKCAMLHCKLLVETKNTTIIQLEPSALLDITTSDITYLVDGNYILYKTEHGEHLIGTLTDPTIKQYIKSIPDIQHICKLYTSKELIKQLKIEVLDLVKSYPDNPVTLEVIDKILYVEGKDEKDRIHRFAFDIPVEGEDCKSHFNVKFLLDAIKFYDIFDSITIYLGEDFPCKFEYRSNMIHADFLIAPRIL